MKQKEVFLCSEGDAYYERAMKHDSELQLTGSDPILAAIATLSLPRGIKVLEIGCGDGERLSSLADHNDFECFGVDPSGKAVEAANKRGNLSVHQGTADNLPFEENAFDLVVFGFCLYLCDREDLFRIACEADRVLQNPGWLLIFDFFSPSPLKRAYSHQAGLHSYKMDYRSLFVWHPAYICYSHQIFHWESRGFTDKPQDWAAVSILRKKLTLDE